jgi:alginate O-acetyltransferase complex protein AlgI
MLFNSLAFAVFLPVVLAGYYVLNQRAQNLWLLAASLVFYGWWDPRFLLLLAVPTVIDYVCALRIAGARSREARKRYLLFSVATNLAILGFFKYFNFFVDSAVVAIEALGLEASRPLLEVVLPVGISFYTFHELSYVIDVYRGHLAPVRDFSVYVLYVLYFPQLVAGPIARASSLLPQLVRKREVTWEHVRAGLVLMLVGFFKKIGIADAVAPLVDERFLDPAACSGADLLLALYLFSLQIYCDFSGYTDIARGVSKLFGIELLLNFNHPYFAENITDFWRRWHISLSTWLRDYLYVPLGGNRGGTLRTYRNLMLTMLLGGLWHGASWTFVVWGGLHGLYLSVHKYFLEHRAPRAERLAPVAGGARLLKIAATFHLVALAWIFFRADSFAAAWAYLVGIATWQPAGAVQPLAWLDPRLAVLVVTFLALEFVQARDGEQTSLLRYHWAARGLSYAWLVVVTLAFGGIGVQIPFIYFQF